MASVLSVCCFYFPSVAACYYSRFALMNLINNMVIPITTNRIPGNLPEVRTAVSR
jgi:hypothetical protein